MTGKLEDDYPSKYDGEPVSILNTDVQEARKRYRNNLKKRFYNELMSCKLEDFCVATFLDPRYKKLEFKNLTSWERGTLTKDTELEWARAAYDADWKPKAVAAPIQVVGSVATASKPKKMLVTFMSDCEDEDDDVVAPSDTHATHATGEDVDEFSLYSTLKPCKKCEDPLEWWVERKHKLPNLFRMARQFLAPPASTAGVERAFTACGQMHSDLKKRITEGTLEHSMMASMHTK
ncbi:hypothetical protein CYMTET_18230 [Cymbomonas tetramitiformis]|uniref:HAT C-terminal dimerisation domain-containing protein n=1 Tax=Cymbomonas tetramitiformis TaxID=36881 RepID=A0AAE0G8Y1_9CHLO|nr:hypothetical protein CYMTET_18230 [Cymbomonas tetramitiformis]